MCNFVKTEEKQHFLIFESFYKSMDVPYFDQPKVTLEQHFILIGLPSGEEFEDGRTSSISVRFSSLVTVRGNVQTTACTYREGQTSLSQVKSCTVQGLPRMVVRWSNEKKPWMATLNECTSEPPKYIYLTKSLFFDQSTVFMINDFQTIKVMYLMKMSLFY